MSVTVSLYNNTFSKIDVSSTTGLSSLSVHTGEYREPTAVINPEVTIEATEADIASCNYFSIYNGSLVRYYWVTEKTSVRTGLWKLKGTADLRRTFKSAIEASYGIVERNENFYDMYLKDNQIPTSERKTTSVYKFSGSGAFSNQTGRPVVMLVVGGD